MDMPNQDKDPVRHERMINEILQVYHIEREEDKRNQSII